MNVFIKRRGKHENMSQSHGLASCFHFVMKPVVLYGYLVMLCGIDRVICVFVFFDLNALR